MSAGNIVGRRGRPRVVIVGAGFGGLETAKALRHAAVDVTVVDRQNHHCFQPLLYQVATAALSPADVAWPIRHMLAHQRNATVLMAEVCAIDTRSRLVLTDRVNVPYDYLVIATGSTDAYFGRDEWAAVAPGLKGIEDATRIRRRILVAFERAELAETEGERQRLLTFAIVGGGPTGVEMAGAIAEIARHTLSPDFRKIDPRTARILLIEAGPRILPALPARLASYAERALRRMGVEVLTSSPVTNCNRRGIEVAGHFMNVGTIIWAAGVEASPAGAWLGAACDRAGRILVNPDLSVPDVPNVFAIGDVAAVSRAPNQLVPGLAAAAKQMGRYVGEVIAASARGAAPPGPFRYRHQGDLATIGRRAAVVNLKHLQLTGPLGWLFWSIVHIYFLIGLRSRFIVAFSWAWQYLTFQRGARLITGIEDPGETEEPEAVLKKADPAWRDALPASNSPLKADSTRF
jgi:NADH:quinone reductase (non-electrogenic)